MEKKWARNWMEMMGNAWEENGTFGEKMGKSMEDMRICPF